MTEQLSEQSNSLMQRLYVFARRREDGTAFGHGYVEISTASPERALWEAQQQPWAIGTELGVAAELNVAKVEHWVSAERQFDTAGRPA